MATRSKVTAPPPPSSGGADEAGVSRMRKGGRRGLTGFRRYNPDGTYTTIEFGEDEPIGGMPRFSGNILGDPSGWKIPQYYDGDEQDPYNWNPDESYDLQVALVQAGYMSKSSLNDLWGDTASNAFKRALADANRYGISVQELLGGMTSGSGGGGGGGGGGGLGARPISDEDITALANQVAQGTLGRNLRPEELGNFIPAFRGVYETGVTPQVGAENIIRNETAPMEAKGHDLGNVFEVFGSMIGGR